MIRTVLSKRFGASGAGVLSALVLSCAVGGCSVEIRGTFPELVAPGNAFQATAVTVPHGTQPTGVSVTSRHTRASDLNESPPANAAVVSNGDQRSATINAPAGQTFRVFDLVRLAWRVNYASWGQATSSTREQIVRIDPGLTLILAPTPSGITAGETATGRVQIAAGAPEELSVTLEITDEPRDADVTLSLFILNIPQGQTQSETFDIITTDAPAGGGTSAGGAGSLLRCSIRASIADPTVANPGPATFRYQDEKSITVHRP